MSSSTIKGYTVIQSVQVNFVITYSTMHMSHMITELDVVIVALTSATTIFSIIDRVRSVMFGANNTTFLIESLIDARSTEGSVPGKMNGIIQFSDVVFRYPARHKVQVHLCQSIDQSKIYRDLSLQVLSGLDFTIQEGQVVALVDLVAVEKALWFSLCSVSMMFLGER